MSLEGRRTLTIPVKADERMEKTENNDIWGEEEQRKENVQTKEGISVTVILFATNSLTLEVNQKRNEETIGVVRQPWFCNDVLRVSSDEPEEVDGTKIKKGRVKM